MPGDRQVLAMKEKMKQKKKSDGTGYVHDIRDITSVRELVLSSCELYADNIAFLWRDKEQTHTVTYREAGEDIRAVATELLAMGLRGKKIAIMGDNSYQWALSYLAVCSGVGIVMPVDKDYGAEQLEFVMRDSGAAAIIYQDRLQKTVNAACPDAVTIPFSTFPALISAGREKIAAGDTGYDTYSLNPHDFGVLLYTSGTMGVAKGVMLSQYNIVSNVMEAMRVIHVYEGDRALSVLPLHHTYECVAGFLSFFFSGASVAYNASLRTLMGDLRELKPTVLVVVPLLISTFYKKIRTKYREMKCGRLIYGLQYGLAAMLPKGGRRRVFGAVHRIFGGHMRAFLCGAAPLPPEVFSAFVRYGFDVFTGYGLTETSPVCTMHSDWYRSPDDVGHPIAGVRVRITDPDENGEGEIAIRGNNVMIGYYNNPEETAKVIRDGWFYTGDIGVRKPNGAIKITGRAKSMIVTEGGKKIFPEELESCLMNSELIGDCFVFQKPDNGNIVASVIPSDEAEKSEDGGEAAVAEYIKSVNDKFPAYKKIRSFILRHIPFEKTSTKKTKRFSESNLSTEGEIRLDSSRALHGGDKEKSGEKDKK